jgi:hypothetical protein
VGDDQSVVAIVAMAIDRHEHHGQQRLEPIPRYKHNWHPNEVLSPVVVLKITDQKAGT